MSLSADQLYELLPAIHRIRDAERGGALRELIEIIAEQAGVMRDDIERLYENLFIETCDEWVVPYLGDLLGVRGLYELPEVEDFSRRALVANTLRYRRRKGTATVLEQLAFDTTGWRARAVEFFQLTEWTQNDDHVRLRSTRTPDLRDTNALELLDTAFDTAAHTVDVRHLDNGRGRHNVQNVGIYLWRLQAYPVTQGLARPSSQPGGYTCHPLLIDAPLFNAPQVEREITHLAEEINVPGVLRRRPLHEELEARRSGGGGDWFEGDDPVFAVYLDGSETPLDLAQIQVCHLENWKRPPSGGDIAVAVDPVLGRLTLRDGDSHDNVRINYQYGFSGDLGGGPYNRRESIEAVFPDQIDWQAGVRRSAPDVGNDIFASLEDALADWNAQSTAEVGVIAIMDSDTYGDGSSFEILVPAGRQLFIVAADWPERDLASGGTTRLPGELNPTNLRPHVLGTFEVTGGEIPPGSAHKSGELTIDGLLVEGSLLVKEGNLGRLRIAHSTLLPSAGELRIHRSNGDLSLEVVRTICGPVTCEASEAKVAFLESIVDNGIHPSEASTRLATEAITAGQCDVNLEAVTVFGNVAVETLHASNCLFVAETVTAVRRQEGCVRYSWIPAHSDTRVPRQYRCQPATEVEASLAAAGESLSDLEKNAIRTRVRARLVPSFTSQQYGHPGYAQLHSAGPSQIFRGADDGSEMGAFSFLKQPQRLTNLNESLNEYLRLGLEAGLLFVT